MRSAEMSASSGLGSTPSCIGITHSPSASPRRGNRYECSSAVVLWLYRDGSFLLYLPSYTPASWPYKHGICRQVCWRAKRTGRDRPCQSLVLVDAISRRHNHMPRLGQR